MNGTIKPELVLASVRVVNAAQRSLELRDGQKLNVAHSGRVNITTEFLDGLAKQFFPKPGEGT